MVVLAGMGLSFTPNLPAAKVCRESAALRKQNQTVDFEARRQGVTFFSVLKTLGAVGPTMPCEYEKGHGNFVAHGCKTGIQSFSRFARKGTAAS